MMKSEPGELSRYSDGRYSAGAKFFFQIGSGADPAFYPMGSGGDFPGGLSGRVVKLATDLHLVPKAKDGGTIPPLSHTSSWHSA
jgi:hypothetical protein